MSIYEYGMFTATLTKSLRACIKDNFRVNIQQVGSAVYVASNSFAVRMSLPNYDALVRPVTQADPGNFSIGKDGRRDGSMNIESLFTTAVNEKRGAAQAAGIQYTQQSGKRLYTYALYHNADDGTTQAYDANAVGIIADSTPYFTGDCGLVYFSGNTPLAFVLPVTLRDKNRDRVLAAVRSYFTPDATAEAAADAAAKENYKLRKDCKTSNAANDILRGELEAAKAAADALRAELEASKAAADALRAELEALKMQAPAPAERPATNAATNAADELRAYFATLDGVEIKINGERTACPVLWLTGNIKPHADEITARGAKWSDKRSAYYIHIA